MPHFDPLTLVLIGAAGSGILIWLAIGMAYRLGRDRSLRCRTDRFDRLYVETDFTGTHWAVSDTSSAAAATPVGTMHLYQSGSRVMAEGTDLLQRRWTAEGVAFRRGVHLLFVERGERGQTVGSLHLHLDAAGHSMTGMKSTWNGDTQGGTIQAHCWKRVLPNTTATPAPDVDFEQHTSTTEAILQQGHPVFRPIDNPVKEVVATGSPPTVGG